MVVEEGMCAWGGCLAVCPEREGGGSASVSVRASVGFGGGGRPLRCSSSRSACVAKRAKEAAARAVSAIPNSLPPPPFFSLPLSYEVASLPAYPPLSPLPSSSLEDSLFLLTP